MIKIALAGALALAMTSASFAQTTGPSGQQDTNKPGMANPNSGSGMSSGSSMSSDGMKKQNNTGTTGNAMGNQTTPGSTMGPSGGAQKSDKK